MKVLVIFMIKIKQEEIVLFTDGVHWKTIAKSKYKIIKNQLIKLNLIFYFFV